MPGTPVSGNIRLMWLGSVTASASDFPDFHSFIHLFSQNTKYDMNKERAIKVFCRTERP